jgi:hypothetical protein
MQINPKTEQKLQTGNKFEKNKSTIRFKMEGIPTLEHLLILHQDQNHLIFKITQLPRLDCQFKESGQFKYLGWV